jgi:hypothetical protein
MEINTRDVEAEDGHCPECGAMIIPGGVRRYNDNDDDENSGRTNNSEYEYTLEEESELGKDN